MRPFAALIAAVVSTSFLGLSTAEELPSGQVWVPPPGTSWQWQLTGPVDESFDVEVYDIDLFGSAAAVIDRLHADGRRVVCYFSAGAWEDWRPDAAEFPPALIGASNGWPGERWLDIRDLRSLAPIIDARLDMAVAKGCDAVEPDNVDGFENASGFPLSARHQARFNKWLARKAHRRGLAVGLKNDLRQVRRLQPFFDFAVNEQCFEFDECHRLRHFVAAGKAVFGVEYTGRMRDFCPEARAMGLSWLRKRSDLGSWVRFC